MTNKPIKRHEALQSFSRDHHHGLLAAWKLREGMKRDIAASRMYAYIRWFWTHHLKAHFQEEEAYIFPLLSDQDPLIGQAKTEHQRLESLILGTQEDIKTLELIADELQAHIRFEERNLFGKIQQTATTAQLERVAALHKDIFNEDYEDAFWITDRGASKEN